MSIDRRVRISDSNRLSLRADAHQSGGAPQGATPGPTVYLTIRSLVPATTRRAGGSTAAKSRRPFRWTLLLAITTGGIFTRGRQKWPSSSAAVREEEQV
ncbi:hypothetical protein EVAR_34522_1 [Eumeta japonica]|uniref:Uncharacterized protein n=1 Tax=Eumeta variegata TaxID=151549 RepID=A0A4C1Z4S2_EUMVA|nr:hypothetical protein EVAR_34522_1 [Eumeta japonica]